MFAFLCYSDGRLYSRQRIGLKFVRQNSFIVISIQLNSIIIHGEVGTHLAEHNVLVIRMNCNELASSIGFCTVRQVFLQTAIFLSIELRD